MSEWLHSSAPAKASAAQASVEPAEAGNRQKKQKQETSPAEASVGPAEEPETSSDERKEYDGELHRLLPAEDSNDEGLSNEEKIERAKQKTEAIKKANPFNGF